MAIAHYGLTAVDLGLAQRRGRKPGSKVQTAAAAPSAKKAAATKAGPKAAKKAKVVKAAKAPSVAKYADGAGNSWTGNGKRPKWFLDAIAGGKTAEELLVKAPE